MIYEAFYNLITDHTQTPDAIMHLLDTYTRGLDSFSTNRPLQTMIAFACLEALAIRQPKVIEGPWETLVWIIVKYSAFASTVYSIALTNFRETNLETVQWIIDICSQESCPNPCLRLELFRFLICFNCKDHYKYQKIFRDKVIITLTELYHNYTSLTVDSLPNFSPSDLHSTIKDNHINIEFLTNDQDLQCKQSEIIAAVLKLCSMLAVLEKDRQIGGSNQAIGHGMRKVVFKDQLTSCLSFCGLIPHITRNYKANNKFRLYFIQAIGNNFLLLNNMIDTLDTITKVSLCFPEVESLQDEVITLKGKLLRRFFNSHTKKSHKNQYLLEIYGGNSQAKEHHLRYFQNNMVGLGHGPQFDSEYTEKLSNDEIDLDEDIYNEEAIS